MSCIFAGDIVVNVFWAAFLRVDLSAYDQFFGSWWCSSVAYKLHQLQLTSTQDFWEYQQLLWIYKSYSDKAGLVESKSRFKIAWKRWCGTLNGRRTKVPAIELYIFWCYCSEIFGIGHFKYCKKHKQVYWSVPSCRQNHSWVHGLFDFFT